MSPRSFGKINLAACAAAVALLLFLFIFPARMLVEMRNDISALCDELIPLAREEKWNEARVMSQRINERFIKDETMLRFVIDHEYVNEAGDAIAAMRQLALDGEGAELIVEAERLRGLASYMAGIESLTWYNLF